MAERYTKLFELPSSLYSPGAPVMLRAGALLRDNLSRNVLAQLKLYSLDKRTITAVKVAIEMLGRNGDNLGGELIRSYTNLKVSQDEEFGQRTAQVLPFREIDSFRARVAEVRFSDGSSWEDPGHGWIPVSSPKTLAEFYGSEEMAAQFRIRYGTDCVYAPQDLGEIWQCTCGTINFREEKSCHRCHRVRKAQLGVNEASLRHECDLRLKNERITEEAKKEPEKEEEKKDGDVGTFWRTLAVGIPLVLVLAAVIFCVPRLLNRIVPLPQPTPNEAMLASMVAPEETPEPEPTPEPTLSPDEQQLAAYEQACALLESGKYSAARAELLKLGAYRDSERLAQESVYRKAVALYEFIEKNDERDIYALLSMDPGATNRFSLTTNKALDLGSSAVDALRAACGGDPVDVSMVEDPSVGLKPLASCVKELFSLLGDYQDCTERLAKLNEMTDYTRDFYMLCKAGNIYGAYDWLQTYPGDFAGREHWLQLLDLYKPLCGDWVLFSGDYTLLPLTVGHQFPCTQFNSRVMIDGEIATLRLLVREGESEFNIDLTAETGTTSFSFSVEGIYYSAVINQVDHFAYLKWVNGSLTSSCEYERMR